MACKGDIAIYCYSPLQVIAIALITILTVSMQVLLHLKHSYAFGGHLLRNLTFSIQVFIVRDLWLMHSLAGHCE